MKKEVNSPKRFNIPHVYYVPDNRASKCMTMQNLCLSQGLWTACPYSSFCPRQSYACSFLTLSSHTRSSISLPLSFPLSLSLLFVLFFKFLLKSKNLNIFKTISLLFSYKVSYSISILYEDMYSWFFLKSM